MDQSKSKGSMRLTPNITIIITAGIGLCSRPSPSESATAAPDASWATGSCTRQAPPLGPRRVSCGSSILLVRGAYHCCTTCVVADMLTAKTLASPLRLASSSSTSPSLPSRASTALRPCSEPSTLLRDRPLRLDGHFSNCNLPLGTRVEHCHVLVHDADWNVLGSLDGGPDQLVVDLKGHQRTVRIVACLYLQGWNEVETATLHRSHQTTRRSRFLVGSWLAIPSYSI